MAIATTASATAFVGLAGVLLGSFITSIFAHYREKGNRKNALELKNLEIAGQYNQKWFEDRKEAYAELIDITSTMQTEKYSVTDLSQALATVRLVSNSSYTLGVADELVNAAKRARKRSREVTKQNKEVGEDQEARQLIEAARARHTDFTNAAKAELYGRQSKSTLQERITKLESEQQEANKSWWRRFFGFE